MNMKIFVNALTDAELADLASAIDERRARLAMGRPASELDSREWEAIALGRKIDAIRLYRARVGLTIAESKLAIEAAIEKANRL